ncbi:hypothetical protein [Actinomyces wuliandei]|uniref:hypothetical protein n=1 Tax=Actinomyces wuliandei TaxID=2057743 RepID=UPI000FDC24D1|nr:hypothetical protein [Actinomyces wuliandei]
MRPRSRQQRWVSIVVYVLILLVVVGMVLSAVGTAFATERAAPGASKAPVVVLGTSNLTWSDLTTLASSQDAATAEAASTVLGFATVNEPLNLAVRTPADRTCPADGWLTLTAGTRVRAVEGSGACTWERTASGSGTAASRQLANHLNEHGLSASGATSVTAVGQGARHALGTQDRTTLEEALAGLTGMVPRLVLVDTTPQVPAEPGSPASQPATATPGSTHDTTDDTAATTGSDAPDDAARLRSLAQALSTTLATTAPAGTRVVITSVADDEDPGPQVTILPAGTTSPRGTRNSLLVGASTHQPGLIQLTDLAPTLTQALTGTTAPDFDGQALTLPATTHLPDVQEEPTTARDTATRHTAAGSSRGPTAEDATGTVDEPRLSALADDALHARASQRAVIPTSLLLTGTAVLLLAWAALALRAPQNQPRPGLRRRVGRLSQVAAVAAAAPLGALLANAVPWWRWGAQGGTPAPWVAAPTLGLVLATSAVLAGCLSGVVAVTHTSRDPALPPPAASAPGATAYLLATATVTAWLTDAALGARLAFNSPLGMNAVVAGRFYGVSNTAFALTAGALVVALAVTWQVLGGGRRTALMVVGLPGGTALAADAAPQLGADVGGALALLPALAALAAGLCQYRLGTLRWAGVAVASGGVVAALAAADYLRPQEQRTHLGRFAAQVLDGTALTALARRLGALITPFATSTAALAALVAGVAGAAALLAWARHERRRWLAGRSRYAWLTQIQSAQPRAAQTRAEPTQATQAPSAHDQGTQPQVGQPGVSYNQWLRPALTSLAVLTAIAVLVNDSGITVAGFVLAGSAPALLALALGSINVPAAAGSDVSAPSCSQRQDCPRQGANSVNGTV